MKTRSSLVGAMVGSEVELRHFVSHKYDPSLEEVTAPGGTGGHWEAVGGTWSAS